MKKLFLVLVVFGFLFAAPKGAFASSLSLSPASVTKMVGDTFNVDIILDPGTDSVSAVSAIVDYDTTKLTAMTLTKGALFSSDPLTNTIDTTAGKIRYDTGTLGTAVTTRGVVATVSFRAIAVGTANATIEFDPTLTTGTSLVAAASGPTNLLTQVGNGIYTITSSATPYVAQPLPQTGAFENTLAVIIGGALLILTGAFLARRYA